MYKINALVNNANEGMKSPFASINHIIHFKKGVATFIVTTPFSCT